jgi:O-antigen/teichoic acid export membrane protein
MASSELKAMNNISIITFSQIIIQFFTLIKWFLLISYLSVDEYGYYSIIIKIVVIIAPIVSLGLGNALVIYIPTLKALNYNPQKYLKATIKYLIFSIIIFSLCFFIIIWIPFLVFDNIFYEFSFLILFIIIGLVLSNFCYLCMISFNKIIIAAIILLIQSFFPLILIIYFILIERGLFYLLLAIGIGQMIAVIPGFLYLLIHIINKQRQTAIELENSFFLNSFKKYNLYFIIFNLASMFYLNIEPVLIYFLIDIKSSSSYSYMLALTSFSLLSLRAINLIITPEFSKIINNDEINSNREEISNLFKLGFHFSFWMIILTFVFIHNLFVFIPEILKIKKFNVNITQIYFLAFFYLFHFYAIINISLLSTKEKMSINSAVLLITCFFLVILNLIFTPIFGIYGTISVKIFVSFLLCIILFRFNKDILDFGSTIKKCTKLFIFLLFLTITSTCSFSSLILFILIIDLIVIFLLLKDEFFKIMLNQIFIFIKSKNQDK